MIDRPEWWDWEIDASLSHRRRRMRDRGFDEIDLRVMLEDATGYYEDYEPDRFVVETEHAGGPWQVIVEPRFGDSRLVVITAYPVE